MNVNSRPSQASYPTSLDHRWWLLSLAAFSIVASFAVVGMSSLWSTLHDDWTNIYGAFSHGYLVLGMCVWLGITYWRESPPRQLAPSWLSLVPLLLLALTLGAMDALFLNASRLTMLPFVFTASVAAVFGFECALTLLWPSAFLFFALPQWWAINGVLQSLTSGVVGWVVKLTDLPAYVEGNYIHVPAGVFQIASGCSGLSYLIAALSLAGFYALMYLQRWRYRLAVLALAALMAIVANWTRVYSLIVIGIVTDMQHYLIRVEHLYYGWALFMFLMAPVFVLAWRLSNREEELSAAADSPSGASEMAPRVSPRILPAALIAGLILLIPRLFAPMDAAATQVIAALPAEIAGRVRGDDIEVAWAPSFINAQVERAGYGAGAQAIQAYRAVYVHQSVEHRLIRGENSFYGPEWRLAEQRSFETKLDAQPLTVVEQRGYLNGRERLIWSWYWVAGRPASTKLGAKLLEVRGLADRRHDAAAFAISAACMPNCEAARSNLSEFIQRSGTSLRWE